MTRRNGKPQTDRYNGHIVHCDCRKRCAELEAAIERFGLVFLSAQDAVAVNAEARKLLRMTDVSVARKPEVSK